MFKNLKLIFKFIPSNLKRIFYINQILIVLNSFFQILSILSVAPLISMLTDINSFKETLNQFNYLKLHFENTQDTELLIVFSAITLSLFTIANILNAIIYSLQQSFCQSTGAEISIFFLKKFFNSSYSVGVKHNSAYFKSIIEKEVPSFVGDVLMPLTELNSKIITFIIILTTVFIININAAVIVSLFLSIGYFLIYTLVKKNLQNNSRIMSLSNIQNTKILNEAFNSFKESKIFNFENYFINYFTFHKLNHSRSVTKNLILQNTPKFFLEIIAIAAIVFTIFFLANTSNSGSKSLVILGIYVAAGYKLMPIMQSILYAFSNVRGRTTTIKLIYDYFKTKTITKNIIPSPKNINSLKIEDFRFKFQNRIIFNKANFELKENNITGLYGKSGSGKTTLSNILMGFYNIDKGKVFLNKKNILTRDLNLINQISFVPQKIYLFNENIIKNITFKNEINKKDYKRIIEILHYLDLKIFIKNNKIKNLIIKEDGKNLSGGQIQRIGLARALFKDSKIIILDEFTSNLDNITENRVLKKIKKIFKGKCVLMISHKLSMLKLCDYTYKIQNHKLIKYN